MPFDPPPSATLIRRLRPTEAALVNHLALATLWNVELPGRPLAEIHELLRQVPSVSRILAEGGSYFVAEIAGVVAAGGGWSAMAVDERPACRQAVLTPFFFIDPDEARRGLRARLLAHVESDIARAGFSQVSAIVPRGSATAYESLGYRSAQATGAGTRLPAVRLRKALSAELAAVA